MAKNLKLLLVAFSTMREVDGEERRVRFGAKKVVELTDDELETLDRLTKATGKLHYRDPISEGGAKVVASEPEVVVVPDYAGQDVAITDKSVDQLKAYLTFHSVEFKGNASKADLLAAAQKHEAGTDGDADPDAGL
ncbi:MAG: hypothetical protein ABFE01_01880 [Phycisphaerales bacterium]